MGQARANTRGTPSSTHSLVAPAGQRFNCRAQFTAPVEAVPAQIGQTTTAHSASAAPWRSLTAFSTRCSRPSPTAWAPVPESSIAISTLPDVSGADPTCNIRALSLFAVRCAAQNKFGVDLSKQQRRAAAKARPKGDRCEDL
jgi:hypothetical protein